MKTGESYQPFRDPIFWVGIALYLLNKLWLKSHVDSAFLKGYLTDVLAIPIGAPVMIWLLQKLKLRDDSSPQNGEVLVFVLIYSVLFELIMPPTTMFGKFAAGDVYDVMAYLVGGIIGLAWWRFRFKAK